jgi:hypothetical protein
VPEPPVRYHGDGRLPQATDANEIIFQVEHVIDPRLDWDAKALVFGQLWWNVHHQWAPAGETLRDAYAQAKAGTWEPPAEHPGIDPLFPSHWLGAGLRPEETTPDLSEWLDKATLNGDEAA